MSVSPTRRKFVCGMGAGLAAMSVPFVARKANAGSGQIVISSWGGSIQEAMRKAYFEPFEKETGIKVVEQTYGIKGLSKLKLQMAAGGAEIDLLDGPPFWTAIGRDNDITDSIDYSDFHNTGDHMPEALNDYGYSYGTVSWGLAYNTRSYPNGGPQSWADAWDTDKFPGLRSMFAPIAARHIEYALMADGLATAKVNPLDDAKIDRGFKKLADLKDHVGAWYGSLAQAQSLLLSQEIDVAEFVNGRAHAAQDLGEPIEFTYNEAVMNLLTWVLAKGAPNRDNAIKFLAFSSRPDRQAAFAEQIYYGPTNSKGLEYIGSDKTLSRLPSYPDNMAKQVLLDGEFWAKNIGKLKSRWAEITSG